MKQFIKKEKLPCPKCGSKWTYWRVYRKHFICYSCGNEFPPYDINEKPIEKQKLPCPQCGSKWTYYRVYQQHFVCHTCGNEFQPYKTKEILNADINTRPDLSRSSS